MNYDAAASGLCSLIENALIELKKDPITLRMALNLPYARYPHEIKRVLESLLRSSFKAFEIPYIKKFIHHHPLFYEAELKKAGEEFLAYAHDMRWMYG